MSIKFIAPFSCLLLLVFLSFASVGSDAVSCTAKSNGDYYDLSPLQDVKAGFALSTQDYTYYAGICANPQATNCVNGTVCQVAKKLSTSTICGRLPGFNFTDIPKSDTNYRNGIILNYYGGAPYANKVSIRRTQIVLICDPNAGIGTITSVKEVAPVYTLTMSSQYACPTTGGGGLGGWIFVIIVLVGFVLYLILGFVYNIAIKKEPLGVSALPNSTFWFGLPGLIKDGCLFVFNSIFRRGGGGYTQV